MKDIAEEGKSVGDYKITTQLKDNAVYQWANAINSNNRESVVLQLLRLDFTKEELDIIVPYFDQLQKLSRKGLMLPTQNFSLSNTFVVVYSNLQIETLDSDFDKQTPERIIQRFKDASEALFFLHNKDLVHGYITPESFGVVDEVVCLTVFGYAPLLKSENQDVLRECGGKFLAPEVSSQHSVTPAADVYAFAKTVVHWVPELKKTQWYEKATASNPSDRFENIRELFGELEKTVKTSEQKKKGDIEPKKYKLQINVEPEKGGTVTGKDLYYANDTAKVTANATDGWKFESWSGHLESKKNSAMVTMDGDKDITAHFVKILPNSRSEIPAIPIDQEITEPNLKTPQVPPSVNRESTEARKPIDHTDSTELLPANSTHSTGLSSPEIVVAPPPKKIPRGWLFFGLILVFAALCGGLYLFSQNENFTKETEVQQLLKAKNQDFLIEAEAKAKEAREKTKEAKTVDDFNKAKSLWKQNLDILQKVSSNSLENQKVETLKKESNEHIKDLEHWIKRECKTGLADFCLE